ncbi:prolyl 4-hydroxylase subunit alpha-1-like isoform X2 [Ylistrum balloti]|uniref:prolyl 4-hydroxylase subunit alpha-1-like isoform X2 n=1 Tax=Ylistrum balloti TaxID=509963 RepID=UPI002905CF84|nr:prolyl 4-hydroxylase subunit alpha-1-like isoform X2 [Ylistrum balloti]
MTAFLVWYACVALITMVRGEMFTSLAAMQTALWAEREIATTINDYVQEEEARLAKLKQLASDMADHSTTVLQNPEKYLGNPVNAYLLIKGFTIDWDRDVTGEINSLKPDLEERIQHLRESLPSYEDLNGAVVALLRLQDTYKLDTDRIAGGDLQGTPSVSLTAEDCFTIGRLAYSIRDYYHTSLWMQTSLNQDAREINKTAQRSDILDYLSYSNMMEGNLNYALTLTEELLTLAPDNTRAQNNKRYYQKMLNDRAAEARKLATQRGETGEDTAKQEEEVVKHERQLDEYRNSEEFATYEKLCRGETTHVYKHRHQLVCRYHTNNMNPLLILSPMRMEEIYLDPYLIFFHQALTDNEMEVIKDLATPRLGRATVHNAKTGKLETATYRISKSAWLKDEDDLVIQRVNRRIEASTGLDMATAEDLQIANYGLGGHYEPHFDFARKEEKHAFKSLGTGNRIATWLTYMSDVEAGGATVFPYIGVKIFPEKGGAAFWYNLYKSGEGIYNTRHAACPVLVGAKWVSNKWIHERGQEFRRRCGLHPDD